MRITLWVRPRSERSAVGGDHGGSLVVRVQAAPERGKATEQALRVLADALGVRRNQVSLVSGRSSRTKVVEVDADDEQLAVKVATLR
jgi:uncharacterized protein